MSERTLVVGGGLAGVAAATALSERGLDVTLFEREAYLGGRAGAWRDTLADGTSFSMERGFHAFFRHYDNVRALLRRVDPTLSCLLPLDDYPLLAPFAEPQSFVGLPTSTPLNVLALLARSPHVRLRDLVRSNLDRARSLLSYDHDATYRALDGMTAREFLDDLRFPAEARQMLFDVFAHSFFNPEEDFSAAELLGMFHFYFTGNSRGLVFDVAREPFDQAIWEPLAAHLARHRAESLRETTVERIERHAGGWRVVARRGDEVIERDGASLVLAVTVPALQGIVRSSPALAALLPAVEPLDVTLPFAVLRLWLDRPCNPERAPFAGTTGFGLLDNISLYERFEGESRAWAHRTGGSVVELHAYAVPQEASEASLRAELLEQMGRAYPETRQAHVLDERFLLRQDCPAFRPGSDATRPGVTTAEPTVMLAGDFVKLPFPSALMERAVASGFLAANAILERGARAPVPVVSASRRGLLAGLDARLAARRGQHVGRGRTEPVA